MFTYKRTQGSPAIGVRSSRADMRRGTHSQRGWGPFRAGVLELVVVLRREVGKRSQRPRLHVCGDIRLPQLDPREVRVHRATLVSAPRSLRRFLGGGGAARRRPARRARRGWRLSRGLPRHERHGVRLDDAELGGGRDPHELDGAPRLCVCLVGQCDVSAKCRHWRVGQWPANQPVFIWAQSVGPRGPIRS